MSDIFREIDEELRRDNLLKLWSRYGRYVIVAAAVVLVVAGAFVAWRDHQAKERRAQSERYSSALALVRAGKDGEAAQVFASVGMEGGGYGVLAAFQEAELLAKGGDQKGAAAAYDRIAAAGDVDRELRDAAVLLSVMQTLPDGDSKAAVERLDPLTASGSPWRGTALELTAVVHLKMGDQPGALEIYRKLADDLAAPQGVRARAAEMVSALQQ